MLYSQHKPNDSSVCNLLKVKKLKGDQCLDNSTCIFHSLYLVYFDFVEAYYGFILQTSPVKLLERSVYSARFCFMENLHRR